MFVMRDENGVIIGVFASAQPRFADEYLPADDQQITEFYERLREEKV